LKKVEKSKVEMDREDSSNGEQRRAKGAKRAKESKLKPSG
jgi:hypothetical protein